MVLHSKAMQIQGTLTGFVPDFYNPTYNGEPCDLRLKVLVKDSEDLLDQLSRLYDDACDWYRSETGKKSFYDPPFETQEDGSVLVKLTAKKQYEEFPLPVIDTEMEPIAKDLKLSVGTEVLVSFKSTKIPRKSSKGGLRLVPQGVQILKAVTFNGSDGGDFDINKAFSKQPGFKQSKPNLKELATVSGEDPDF